MFEGNGVEGHKGQEVADGEFLKPVIKVHRVIHACRLHHWEYFERLEKNTVNLWAKGVGSGIVPQVTDLMVSGNDVIVASYNNVGHDLVAAAVDKYPSSEVIDAIRVNMVFGRGKT
jgi:hypothetical protein